MRVNVSYNGKVFISDVLIADDFWSKLSGYMFRGKPHVPAIMFEPAKSIHTNFMRFNLDLVFLTKDNEVIKIIRDMKPWRFTAYYFNSTRTLEMPVGHLPSDLKVGDKVEVTNV